MKKKRTARKVVRATLIKARRRGFGDRWSLELECDHMVWRPVRGSKPPTRVNSCEKCFTAEVWAGFRRARR